MVLQGIRIANLVLGQGVVICGAGPIGLIALAAARASGAHPIVITDLEPKRLEFAKQFVPSCRPYLVDRTVSSENNAANVRKLFGDSEYVAPETILECTGVEGSIVTACYTVRRGGSVVVIGVGKSIMNNLPFMHISLAEVRADIPLMNTYADKTQISLRFINRYRDTWPRGISALSGGVIDLKPLVTHTFSLENAVDAMSLCSDPSKGSIKVQIVDDADAEEQ